MPAASRESLAAARSQLDEIAERADSAELTTLAEELLGVGRLLAREAILRRALSDPAARVDVRRGLLDAVVGEQLGRQALDLLHELVASRWSAPGDLVDACELLGVQALLAAAQADEDLGDVEDELFRFLRVVSGDAELRGTLGESTAGVDRRQRLVDDLLGGKAKPVTVALVKIAVGGLGGCTFEPSLERLVELAAQRRDREAAYVTVATALTEEQERQLEAALGGIYRRKVTLLVVVDPTIVGGMTVRVGDELYDGSVARRLARVRDALAG